MSETVYAMIAGYVHWDDGPNWLGREYLASRLPQQCHWCGEQVVRLDDMAVGHVVARTTHPHLGWEPDNLRAEHKWCSGRWTNVIESLQTDVIYVGPRLPRHHLPSTAEMRAEWGMVSRPVGKGRMVGGRARTREDRLAATRRRQAEVRHDLRRAAEAMGWSYTRVKDEFGYSPRAALIACDEAGIEPTIKVRKRC